MSKNIAVILSGCGVFDGAEIHESVCTFLALDKAGANYSVFAPDMDQHHVINHITGEEMDETRNVMVEAARISRGAINDLADFDADDFDAVILTGGFGAAKNLSSFAFDGAEASVNDDVKAALQAMKREGKPIGALCISPAILAAVFGDVLVTVGADEATIGEIEACGARHQVTGNDEIVIDAANKIVTSPCYMLDTSVKHIAIGAENTVNALLDLCA
ncbi:MAG: isoprenoid biosynthesis glyoxalase ElbB [Pseudomonadota bacterium]|nr:isoprenoid biosynthesis glyoxalase ElbB [Pseudomonadota bacterium]